MNWRALVLRVMRVPPEPVPPPGSTPRIFRAAPNYQIFLYVEWAMVQIAAAVGLLFGLFFFSRMDEPGLVMRIFQILEAIAIVTFVFQMIATLLVVRLKFELRWYMVSDRSIRIREGITTVLEKTIALANIQNIAVRQGPLQRLLGIADVEVKTAGGGGGESQAGKRGAQTEAMHVAYFRGVDNQNEIRDLLREGVRRQRDAGLGDPDDHHRSPDAERDAAVKELLEEARQLRQVVSRSMLS